MRLCLEARGIFKKYGETCALLGCDVSFDHPGVYVLTGPTGCGKSTLLRICALLEPADSGTLRFSTGGVDERVDLDLKRRITLLLPKVGVFSTSVYGNAAYGLGIRGIRGEEAEKKADEALDFVGLLHKKKLPAHTLSSGETQRLGIARALVIEPELLFLDEPTASVDEKNTRALEELILRLKEKGNTGIVMTTHDRMQAERIGDFMISMKGGRIL